MIEILIIVFFMVTIYASIYSHFSERQIESLRKKNLNLNMINIELEIKANKYYLEQIKDKQ